MQKSLVVGVATALRHNKSSAQLRKRRGKHSPLAAAGSSAMRMAWWKGLAQKESQTEGKWEGKALAAGCSRRRVCCADS